MGKQIPVDREHYLWAVARYIEQNTKRAKIVKKEEEYSYSSAKAHIEGRGTIYWEKIFLTTIRGNPYIESVYKLLFCHPEPVEGWGKQLI